jgi:hypothetical protein
MKAKPSTLRYYFSLLKHYNKGQKAYQISMAKILYASDIDKTMKTSKSLKQLKLLQTGKTGNQILPVYLQIN